MKEVASIMFSNDQDKFIKTRLSRMSDRSTTVETVSQSSFILQKSRSYSGPHPVTLQIWNSDKPRHFQFKPDPLYRFPILNDPRSIYRVADSWILISKEDCTFIDEVDIKSTLKNLQASSPFKRGNYDEIISDIQLFAIDETFAEETKKVNQENFPEEFSNESATPTKKITIKLPKKDEMWKINNFDQEIIQYNPHTTPASSIEFNSSTNIVPTIENTIDLTNDFENPKKIIDPRSSISSISSGSNLYQSEEFQKDFNEFDFDLKRKNNVISSISEEDCYQITSSEEAEMSNNLPSHMAELLPENSEEMSKNLFNSRYALSGLKINHATLKSSCSSSNGSTISADEGSIHITNRVFLQDCGATKQVMKGMCFQPTIFAKIPPKNLTNSDLKNSEEISFGQETDSIDFPDIFSPLYKKIIICELEEDDRFKRLEIVSSCTCAGFLPVPQLEFTNIEGKSKAFISFQPEKPQALISLLAPEILGSFISTPVSWITCGFEHCCLVTTLGSVMSWGYGASGCLGHGNTNSYIFPTLITDLANKVIVYMESGAYHNAAISSEGELFVWGRGDVNQLGISSRSLSKDELGYVALRPLRNDYFFKNSIKVTGIACGEAHTLALDSSGSVYSFGWSEFGQLGLPLNEVKNNSMTNICKKIMAFKNQKIIKIGAGSIFSAALSEYGQLFTWGNGDQGQLGLGNSIKSAQFPVIVDHLNDEFIIDFICGEYNIICLSESKKLYGWGQGIAGVFQNMQENYPVGSELICYVPRLLAEVEIAHRFIISKRNYYPKLHQKGFLSQSLLDDSDSIV